MSGLLNSIWLTKTLTKLNADHLKVLRNSGVVVEEDLSRAAKNRRRELEKFVKEIKAIDGNKKCVLK